MDPTRPHSPDPSHIVLQVVPQATLPLATTVARRNMQDRKAFAFSGHPDTVARYTAMGATEREGYTLLHGHVPFGVDALLPCPATWVTLLRDPAETAIAFYYMVRSSPTHYLHAMLAGGEWSLTDLAHAGRPEIDNVLVRWLNPPLPPGQRRPFGSVTREMLEVAKRNLEERYTFGLAERFDESMLLWERALGWNARYAGLGEPPARRLADDADPRAVEQIEAINPLDRELYQFAARLFDERLAKACGDVGAEVTAYRERNRARPGTMMVAGEEVELAPPPDDGGRRDVVWIASYPRSGNTWLRFLLDAYFFGPAQHLHDLGRLSMELDWWLGVAREHLLPASWIAHVGRTALRGRPRRLGLPDHVFIKTHFPAGDRHPLIERTRAAVLLVRDPRDVLLSGLNFTELNTGQTIEDPVAYAARFAERGGPDHWLDMGYGTWDEHAASWASRTDFPVLVVRYEDLKADPRSQFRRVLDFLAVPIDEARLEQAVAKSAFDRLRHLEVASRATSEIPGMARSDRFFFHKGQTGQSLSHLGEDLEVRLVGRFEPTMARYGYAARRG